MPRALVFLLIASALVACSEPGDPTHFDVTLEVVDDLGAPVAGATVDLGDHVVTTDGAGLAGLAGLTGPVLAVVSGADLLAEPVAVGRADAGQVVLVRAWRGLGGRRWAMHSGGDVMFGRRYNQPTDGAPLIGADDPAAGAAAVVEPVRRAFTAADLRTLNLETVVSNLPPEAAYPGKRFILNSWPETLAGVSALAPQVVILANNHARDYLDVGVAETVRALDDAGLAWLGASAGAEPADAPLVVDVAGQRVGVLAWTTVDGSFVNDSYPRDGDPVPGDVSDGEAWQYEPRSWGWTGADWTVPTEARRIGSAWALFAGAEPALTPAEVAGAWASLVAVYPELQDWVARRGHGGAAEWVTARSPAQITTLAAEVDVVVVQLHAGFQFQPAPSDYVRDIAHRAIDAGADVVIAHHPHVLQGAEWYQGKLIVYSLGNFVFDQDFLSTFSSAFLRTVWEDDQLVEARLLPVELAAYRPTPAADHAARRALLRVWEMSASRTASGRDVDGDVRVFATELPADSLPAHVRIEHHSAVFLPTEPTAAVTPLRVDAGATAGLPATGLIDPRLGLAAGDDELLIGRDLLGWGGFEDQLADGVDGAGAHWVLEGTRKRVVTGADAPAGVGFLRLERANTNVDPVTVRPVARIPMPAHRLYQGVSGGVAVPLDPTASYELRARVRLTGDGEPSLRLDLYAFDDSNPTEDPSSALVSELRMALSVAGDGQWHDVAIPVAAAALQTDGVRANMVMINLGLGVPTESSLSTLDVDQLVFVEWRAAAAMPDRWGVYELVRNVGARARDLDVTVLPAGE